MQLVNFLAKKVLPDDPREAKSVLSLAGKGFYVMDGILYYEGADVPDRRHIVVPEHLKQEILDEHHDSIRRTLCSQEDGSADQSVLLLEGT